MKMFKGLTEIVFCILLSITILSWKADKKDNDWTKDQLKGDVKSLTESYNVLSVLPFGTFEKQTDSAQKSLMKKEMFYDENGNKIEWNSINKDGSIDFKRKYKFDQQGNLIEWGSYNQDETIRYKAFYTYNDKGQNIEERKTYNSAEIIESKATFKYDNNGNLIEWITFKSDDSVYSKLIYKYDKSGNKIEYIWLNLMWSGLVGLN